MDIVQNCDSYINIPSSQTYRTYTSSVPHSYFNFNVGWVYRRHNIQVALMEKL
jgi:hypothetical protein